MSDLRVIVAGSRWFNDAALLESELNRILGSYLNVSNIIIVSGTAQGADAMGILYGKRHGHRVERYPANWSKHGRSAGYRRNVEMSQVSDILVAFWDGESRGTKHMIDIMTAAKKPVHVVRFP